MTQAQTKTQRKKAVAPTIEKSISERFLNMVIKEFQAAFGGNGIQFSPLQKRLAQHLFIKIDQALQDAEAKRTDGLPITWANINITKLATSAMHRINLGLDALIENHISPIPYYNKRDKRYDIDLRVGYVGKDYYRRKMAIEEPIDVIYELVYKGDKFKPIKKSLKNEIESYEFEIPDPFNRGDAENVVGGFGYILYENSRKNKLVIVTEKDFKKSESIAKSGKFWKDFPINMRYKTLVHRTTEKIPIDPEKINISYAIVERDDQETQIFAEIEGNANREPIDIELEPEIKQGQKLESEPEQQPLPQNSRGPGF